MHSLVKKLILASSLYLLFVSANGQVVQGNVQEGEIGVTLGAAHYFGDLNTRAAINRPKPAVGIFFRKNLHDYIGIRLGLHYAQVGYSDTYSKNEFQKRRNLSFNSNIWEASLQGDFNFMRFVPGDPQHAFTPYVTLGFGVFNYDPYAYLRGKKYILRTLGTEGQGSPLYDGSHDTELRKPYSSVAFCIPLGMGIKYNITPNINLSFEVAYRFTTTDYLDDVSKTYAPDAFSQFTTPGGTERTAWYLLQDRSYDTGDGTLIGEKGRQRGFKSQKDAYVIAEIGVAFNLTSYKCPPIFR